MTVDALTAPTGSGTGPSLYTGATAKRAPKQEMDGELFLKLLVTQLSHQDPSSPMDTNAMISQTTELATMERLTALATQVQESFSLQMRTAASALIGKEVDYLDATGATVKGVATSVSFSGPVPLVNIDGKAVALDSISAVRS
ncbi:flagellar hook capping FlgD N-terminal domain-containing protein [Agromyces sp. NPDC056379]|uniref:flagellar hook capping FlgD N-terminal domain-containing protein n=1 Tax=unclassified Agromyces TaxID=2639701 RepID=UPI0035DD5AD3